MAYAVLHDELDDFDGDGSAPPADAVAVPAIPAVPAHVAANATRDVLAKRMVWCVYGTIGQFVNSQIEIPIRELHKGSLQLIFSLISSGVASFDILENSRPVLTLVINSRDPVVFKIDYFAGGFLSLFTEAERSEWLDHTHDADGVYNFFDQYKRKLVAVHVDAARLAWQCEWITKQINARYY